MYIYIYINIYIYIHIHIHYTYMVEPHDTQVVLMDSVGASNPRESLRPAHERDPSDFCDATNTRTNSAGSSCKADLTLGTLSR